MEILPFPSTNHPKKVIVMGIHPDPSWMDHILTYIMEGNFSKDKLEVEKIKCKSPRYWMYVERKLYKRSYSRPYLLCVYPEAVEVLLEELQNGCVGVTREKGLWPIEL